ncbi:MAG TPA: hypothetical protein VEV41_08070, partial [Terriglobales bacterium]|nr:hypothetical protein [Terriglobales bacterium]
VTARIAKLARVRSETNTGCNFPLHLSGFDPGFGLASDEVKGSATPGLLYLYARRMSGFSDKGNFADKRECQFGLRSFLGKEATPYNYYFREGFRRGYEDGYSSRYYYGRYSNGRPAHIACLTPSCRKSSASSRFAKETERVAG